MISVVIPNYNQVRYLGAAIESVLNQKGAAFELLVVDGGSDDGSVDVIKAYEKHIAYWVSERDSGHYNAVNKGFSKASGDILCFLNSDDMYFPQCFNIVDSVFRQHPSVQWITSLQPAVIDLEGNCFSVAKIPGYSRRAFRNGFYGGSAYTPWYIQQESTFWRRSLWESCGSAIDESFDSAGDFELWSRFFEKAELVGVNALLGSFRIREGQRVSQGTTYVDQCRSILKKYSTERSLVEKFFCFMHKYTIWDLPRIRIAMKSVFGFHGSEISRDRPGSPTAAWIQRGTRYL